MHGADPAHLRGMKKLLGGQILRSVRCNSPTTLRSSGNIPLWCHRTMASAVKGPRGAPVLSR